MVPFCCDLCGKPLLVDEDVRYVVRITVQAAYDVMELTREDVQADHREEMRELIEKMGRMDPGELERQVHEEFTFELCPACRRRYVRDPLSRGTRTQGTTEDTENTEKNGNGG